MSFPPGRPAASLDGPSAVVLPFDSVRVGVACTEELRIFDHTVTLMFTQADEASLAIVSRRWPDERVIISERVLSVR